MTLVVFDLDGTLLNKQSDNFRVYGGYPGDDALTRHTLYRGDRADAASGSRPAQRSSLCPAHDFKEWGHYLVPRGVPLQPSSPLTPQEVWHVLAAFTLSDLNPFVFTLNANQQHALYHGPLKSSSEQKLADLFEEERHLPLEPLTAMPDDVSVINLFSLGGAEASTACGPALPMSLTLWRMRERQ